MNPRLHANATTTPKIRAFDPDVAENPGPENPGQSELLLYRPLVMEHTDPTELNATRENLQRQHA